MSSEEEGGSRCAVCSEAPSKYCCPRCDKRTCSLECVKAHKEATGCTGKRDRTGFVGRAAFDERTFMSDYRFLEEVKLADDVAKRSKPPAPKVELPPFLQTLQYQARRRGVQLHILSPGMEKRRTNTTRYDGRMQTLYWHVEWAFPAAGGPKAADHKVHENTVMADLLAGHLALQPGAATKHHTLRQYSEAGQGALTVLLRKERTPANAVEYFELDGSRPLRTQLAGKVIVEFPTFLVLLPHERDAYHILPQQAQQAVAALGAQQAQQAGGAPQAEQAEQAQQADAAPPAQQAQQADAAPQAQQASAAGQAAAAATPPAPAAAQAVQPGTAGEVSAVGASAEQPNGAPGSASACTLEAQQGAAAAVAAGEQQAVPAAGLSAQAPPQL